MSIYRQGVYTPLNPKKYKGTYPILYRSGLELQFMRKMDDSSSVVEWGSESNVIKYFDPLTSRIRRYFVDFYVVFKDSKGGVVKYLVEVKPHKFTIKPSAGKKSRKSVVLESSMWVKNNAKWQAAQDYCKANGWHFQIITEKDMGLSK